MMSIKKFIYQALNFLGRETVCTKAFKIIDSYEGEIGMFSIHANCALGIIGKAENVYDTYCYLLPIAEIIVNDAGICCANDGNSDDYPQETPKERVLAWLNDAINLGY